VIPFFAFDPAIRKIIYTTNAMESLNRVIRKSIKTRGSFPTDEAVTKLIHMARAGCTQSVSYPAALKSL
jgi:putative transposase